MNSLAPGQRHKIIGFNENINKAFKQKIIALGIRKDTIFTINHLAPFKGPIQIDMGCVKLVLRLADFMQIKTESVQ